MNTLHTSKQFMQKNARLYVKIYTTGKVLTRLPVARDKFQPCKVVEHESSISSDLPTVRILIGRSLSALPTWWPLPAISISSSSTLISKALWRETSGNYLSLAVFALHQGVLLCYLPAYMLISSTRLYNCTHCWRLELRAGGKGDYPDRGTILLPSSSSTPHQSHPTSHHSTWAGWDI